MTRQLVLLLLGLLLISCQRQGEPDPKSAADAEEPVERIERIENPSDAPTDTPSDETIVRLPRHDTTGHHRAATAEEKKAIAELSRAAEQVRQLRFRRPVTIEVEDDIAITNSLLNQIEDEEIERARTLYGALGLVDPEGDLRAVFGAVLSEQVVGYYDPESERLVVRDDVMEGLVGGKKAAEADETRLVLIHELVHALQDQRLGLGDSYEKERSADAENAFRAVVEGDATLAMLGHSLRAQGIPLSVATAGIQQMGGAVDVNGLVRGEMLDDSPPILRVTLIAPYLRGLQFIAAVHAHRGGWPAVNAAYKSPPKTTEQILHPEKFLAREGGEKVRIPNIKTLQNAGYKVADEDTLGELEIGVYLGQGTKSGTDESAGAGWAGDRVRVYRRKGKTAVVWLTTWDTVDDAIEADAAARRVSPPGAASRVQRIGRAVLIIRDLPAGLHKTVRKSFAEFAKRINQRASPTGLR